MIKAVRKPFIFILLLGFPCAPTLSAKGPELKPAQRRMEALAAGDNGAAALPYLATLQGDSNPMVRRAAVRSLERIGPPAFDLLHTFATTDTDLLVRRTAWRALAQTVKEDARLSVLKEGLEDGSDLVRLVVLEALAASEPRSPETLALLREAQNDDSLQVARYAASVLWPFSAEVVSSRDRPELRDSHLDATRLDLSKRGWRFQTDPPQTGHVEGWTTATFDDAAWDTIAIGAPWQDFGYRHRGVAWYRLTFDLPPAPPQDATDLVFDGVDESAWVWINGEFVGARDIGSDGYNKPFAIDTRDLLQWGKPNQLTVRVSKPSGNHAGIWKPVYLEILKKP